MFVTDDGISTDVIGQSTKAAYPISVMVNGNLTDDNWVQPLNASLSILFSPVKYCSSSKEDMLCFLKTSDIDVTAPASLVLSSPSPFLSQLVTQISLTILSAN